MDCHLQPLKAFRATAGWLLAKLTSRLLTLLRNHVPVNLSREEIRYANISFSQFGEDLAISRWVERIRPKAHVYVDVGCFHPIHCSNTLLLHKERWKGVNIDFDADKIEKFRTARPLDHNVVAAVSALKETKLLLRYKSTGTNRLADIGEANLRSAIGEEPLSSVMVKTQTLGDILASAPWPIQQVGYLNIDCEGHDLEVLMGLKLDQYKPDIISIEALAHDANQAIEQYLVSRGYERKETIYKTLIFVKH